MFIAPACLYIGKNDKKLITDCLGDTPFYDFNDDFESFGFDLKKDFYTLYLLHKVEDNFDAEHFYLFRMKTFTNMTYAQLAYKTGMKGVRQKVVDVKNWLKQNVKQEDIRKEFQEIYGDLFLD